MKSYPFPGHHSLSLSLNQNDSILVLNFAWKPAQFIEVRRLQIRFLLTKNKSFFLTYRALAEGTMNILKSELKNRWKNIVIYVFKQRYFAKKAFMQWKVKPFPFWEGWKAWGQEHRLPRAGGVKPPGRRTFGGDNARHMLYVYVRVETYWEGASSTSNRCFQLFVQFHCT